ncbi:MAG: riboflavin synthase, partial [Verrucomicrobiota bacterium]|jgi:riboflavin synthase|nr:riboflavin synthase [Opitutae bacterium]MBO26769.1 riboflavin synthase [Opitutales bacterium]MEC7543686.1 riboflavin synthase [Verrucomicrobiota bacterium]MEC8656802.1 riboflavin synthase [Verrucomicrobiota bacterium]MEC8778035.1 riboflavin synthase [Verrucomicrobiota bacterium]|tara:strand:+ start:2288 stop:2887 length:600 start_codon:yes stop_codon:yes gene_type:complete
MFTGIVESVGEVLSLKEDKDSWVLRLSLPFSGSDGLGQGESLSVNGCCLTLREDADEEASFDLLEETMERTNLGEIEVGSSVNLERSLAANARLGGHFVSGHVDACGLIEIFEERGKNLYLQVGIPADYSRYLVDKGCIALDGCSLTVCDVNESSFAVWLIPHTIARTNLVDRQVGQKVNLEFDLLAKYVEKLSGPILS